jgi:hypothetical protein
VLCQGIERECNAVLSVHATLYCLYCVACWLHARCVADAVRARAGRGFGCGRLPSEGTNAERGVRAFVAAMRRERAKLIMSGRADEAVYVAKYIMSCGAPAGANDEERTEIAGYIYLSNVGLPAD